MRILLISTSFPINEDGSEAAGSFVKDFVETLKEQGHDVVVIAPVTGQIPYTQKNDINYFWFSVPKLPLSLLSPKKPKDWWPVITTLQQGKKVVDQAVKEFRPDHIFALWALPSGHWARYASKRYDIPYSIWALGSDIWSLGKIPIVKHYLKIVLQSAAHRFADGYQLADDVTQISGKSCEFLPSTRQLPVCGLPLTTTKAPYRFCFLGRWHPNKGIDLLLEALHLLENKDWGKIEEVRIAGGGSMENYVNEQVEKLQNNKRPVSLLGFQDKYDAAELLVWTDYVIIPSRIESIPVIFSDAMQAMRPIIAMPVGDLPVLNKRYCTGLMVESVTAQELKKSIVCANEANIGVFYQEVEEASKQFRLNAIATKFVQKVYLRH